ncbi:hypothetical protein Dda_4601 [Drechslerella dactyloides]|uniref:Uncharacterized protein n=1 Tax=Drechslerella dactyloides TaxID=74499 RepID=A0AAD6IX92_DREDA|nr:hypothetical protein Dda_4601 [Drechslerella dactyloides]
MSYDLAGRNVLVTATNSEYISQGGSRGIGEAICERFAQQGANLVINYLSSEDRAEKLKEKLLFEHPALKIVAIQSDVGTSEGCEKLVQQSIEALGGLDVIISNAGWTKFAHFSNLDALTDEDYDKCFAVNCKANVWLLKAAKPTFTANPDGGSLTICASTAGLLPGGSSLAYSVSKAAALHLMRGLASSHGPKIRVNAVCPGLVLTEWGSKFPEEVKEGYRLKSATKAYIHPVTVADAFVFCAQNISMTGQEIVIDGGYHIHA